MDAGEHNLAIAMLVQSPNFGQDLFGRTAGEHGTHFRNDAEGTVEETAVLHLDIRALATIQTGNAARHVDDAKPVQQVR